MTHDDLDARCAEIRRKPHWERTCYDWDDLESELQIAAFKRLADRHQALLRFERDLREAVNEINGDLAPLRLTGVGGKNLPTALNSYPLAKMHVLPAYSIY